MKDKLCCSGQRFVDTEKDVTEAVSEGWPYEFFPDEFITKMGALRSTKFHEAFLWYSLKPRNCFSYISDTPELHAMGDAYISVSL